MPSLAYQHICIRVVGGKERDPNETGYAKALDKLEKLAAVIQILRQIITLGRVIKCRLLLSPLSS